MDIRDLYIELDNRVNTADLNGLEHVKLTLSEAKKIVRLLEDMEKIGETIEECHKIADEILNHGGSSNEKDTYAF